MTNALRVRNVAKEYRVGEHAFAGPGTLYDALAGLLRPSRRSRAEDRARFLAFDDVSFDIAHGEVVGIVGRNGAGKSTLLKVLSRITAPTRGRIELHGRMASLLEVGTGFHPELTGRENIFLNGAILGMRRAEIAQQFDAIVAFAEVERFVDTPVKRYSSGMYVRLAFSVAAHLDADILLVDEVLAVGDAAFQKRCLGKMRDVASRGRTVLFVSHNMAAVQALCTRALYMRRGGLALDASPAEVVHAHLVDSAEALQTPLHERTDRTGDGRLRFTGCWIENARGEPAASAVLGQDNVVCLAYEAHTDLRDVFVAFDIRDSLGDAITNCNTADAGSDFEHVPAGVGVFRCTLPRFPLRGGAYTGNVYAASRGTVNDFVEGALELQVDDADFYGTGSLRVDCKVMLAQRWRCDAAAGREARASALEENPCS